MTPEAQMRSLRQMASGGAMTWVFRAAIGLSLGSLVCGARSGYPPCYMVALISGVLAWASHQTAPHLRRAALALDSGQRRRARIDISIDSASDVQKFRAFVPVSATQAWTFEFIPQGWTPVAGTLEAELCFVPEVEWPALMITQAGLIHPRTEPTAQAAGDRPA